MKNIGNWRHKGLRIPMVCIHIMGWSESKFRVTIHESERDDFRSIFYSNRNRKGFKDTK